MPEKKNKPTLIEAAEAKAAAQADKQASKRVFRSFLGLFALFHFIVYLVISQKGIKGYLHHLRDIGITLATHPPLTFLLIGALFLLYYSIIEWRNRSEQKIQKYPPYPPVPELRFTNDLYLGSAWTRDGKQPGDVMSPDDEVLSPHVILKEKGLVGNLHVKGGVGGGKTATFIEPVIDQCIMKYPKPHPPEFFPLGPDGRYAEVAVPPPKKSLLRRKNLEEPLIDPFDRASWNPYVGMTPEEAQAEYERLLEEHEQKKWFLFVIDPKGDLTDFVIRSAIAAGRENDVIVLEPGGEYTYNPLAITDNDLVLAELIMDGIEAGGGQTIPMYWRNSGSDWLANALSILRAASPAKLTFKSVLTMARSEQMRHRWVDEAEAKMREYQEEEERCRRLGREYHGKRVNPAAVEFFRDWDDLDNDPAMKRNVVSSIKNQTRYFVDGEMAPFLCPEMPATFEGFEKMIDKGQIVVLRCPIGEYGPVGKVLGILLLADAQQAARVRIIRPDMNQERMGAFIVDEMANYLNKLTREFISINRQSRVACIFAHQSQGQLMEDKKTETSFNDNLRTKISFNAPNAEAGRREASLFGSRLITKEVYSESTSLQRVEREDDGESLRAKGGESKGVSVRLEEVERPWFKAEDFVSLKLGECIVSEFTGITTLPPRKIKAPLYFLTPRVKRLEQLPIPSRNLKPHPVVHIQSKTDESHLATALESSGFIITETLQDADGRIRGLKFVTEVGTILVPYEYLLGDASDIISERLRDSESVVVLADIMSAKILRDTCGVTLDTPLPLPAALKQNVIVTQNGQEISKTLGELVLGSHQQISDYRSLVHVITEEEIGYLPNESWNYHWKQPLHDNKRAIVRDSRLYIKTYERIGHVLYDLGPSALEDLYEELRILVDDAMEELRPIDSFDDSFDDSDDLGAENVPSSFSDDGKDLPDGELGVGMDDLEFQELQDVDSEAEEEVGSDDDGDWLDEDVPAEIDIALQVDEDANDDIGGTLFGEDLDDIDIGVLELEADPITPEADVSNEVDSNGHMEGTEVVILSVEQGADSAQTRGNENVMVAIAPEKPASSKSKKTKQSTKLNKQNQQQTPLTLFDLDDVIAPTPFDLFTPPNRDEDTD